MPLRNQPNSLQRASMVAIARNFDYICYGAKNREQMCAMIYDESYQQVAGPFLHLPSAVLSQLMVVMVTDLHCRRLSRTHYHALIQPHLEEIKLASSDGESLTALKLLLIRCKEGPECQMTPLTLLRPLVIWVFQGDSPEPRRVKQIYEVVSHLNRDGRVPSPSHHRHVLRASPHAHAAPSSCPPFHPPPNVKRRHVPPYRSLKPLTPYRTQNSRPSPHASALPRPSPTPCPRQRSITTNGHVAAAGLLAGLLDEVRDLGRIRRHHLHTLVLPQLQDFSITSVGEIFLAVQLLMQRCRRLKRVNLSYLRNVSPGAMLQLATCFTEVTHLDLSMTQIIDQMLEVVGRYCKHLRELDVTNTSITDSALMRLSYNEKHKMPMCQKLEKVSVTGCILSPTGPAYLLHYLPRLYHLDYEHMFQVFEVLQEWGVTKENMTQCEPYPLRVLTSISEYIDPASVDVAVTLCPMVLEVTLSNAMIENELLYQTMRLEHLAHLRITNSEGLTLNFQEGILPVLTLRGHGLISLLLANFTVVDLVAVGECCPRLQNLAFSDITVYEDIMYPRDHLFTTLVNLEVWTSVTTDTCNAIILKQLLGHCPGLQNLLVRGADALSDKLLQDLWQTNPMPRLSRLTLDSCHNISTASIYYLLEEDNNLTLLRVWSCFLITRQDSKTLQEYIKDHNCDLYLEWYCWDG